MGVPLPPEIQVIDLPDGVQYRLPPRPSRLARGLGLCLIVFGAAGCGFDLSWSLRVQNFLLGPAPVPWLPQALLVVQDVVAVVSCLGVCCAGLFLLAGHSEVELRAGRLRAVERAGWLRWARARPRQGIRRLVVSNAAAADGTPAVPDAGGYLAVLRAQGEGAGALWLAPLYPRAWLGALADNLTRRLADSGTGLPASAPSLAVVVGEQAGGPLPDEFPDRPEPPATSAVVLERGDGGLTLAIPPQELGLGGGLLLHGAVESFVLAGVMTAWFLRAAAQAGGLFPGLWVILAAPWLMGLGMVLAFIHTLVCRWTLTVTGEGLTFVQSFPSRRREWTRDQLESIRVDPAENRQFALRIGTKQGQMVRLLPGRPREELEWIATVLRQALGVPATRPLAGGVEVERDPSGITLRVPPAGVRRGSGGLFDVGMIWTGCVLLLSVPVVCAGAPWGMYLFLLLFLGIGAALLLGAFHRGRRQTVLAVVQDTLMVLETGPVGSKRGEWPRERISHVCVGPNGTETNGRQELELQIHLWSGNRFGLLAGRDEDELYALAAALRQVLHVPASRPEGGPTPFLAEQPADSAALLERQPDGLVLRLPPAGFRRGNVGLLVCGLIWSGLVLVAGAAAVCVGVPWGVYLGLAVFGGLGAAVLFAALQIAHQSATLTVRDASLMIHQVGPLGGRRHQWPDERLARIDVGPSGMKIGTRDILELQVHLREGKKRGFLRGRNGEELSWVAGVLCDALHRTEARSCRDRADAGNCDSKEYARRDLNPQPMAPKAIALSS